MQLLFTGLEAKDFENREENIEGVCYLCKRKGTQDSLILQSENDDDEFGMIFKLIWDAFQLNFDDFVPVVNL